MIVTVLRITSDDNATLSLVAIDSVFQCFGLEDEYRVHKIPAETRIPPGEYKIKVRDYGKFHARYSRRFPDLHQGMLEICNVAGFTDILIHIGNTDDDTAGCLLLGSGCNTIGEITVTSSRSAYLAFYAKVIDDAIAGNLTIDIIDGDRT